MVDKLLRKEDLKQATPSELPVESAQEHHAASQEQHMQATEQREAGEHQTNTDKQEGFIDESIDSLRKKLRRPKKQKPTTIPQVRDELTVKVEKIMQEGLVDAFKELDPVERQEFKMKGEETALKIRELLKGTNVKIKKIFKLLFEWLKMLPGINRFYLEQEAKIKADSIVAMKDQYKDDR